MSKVPLCDAKGIRKGDFELPDALLETRHGRKAVYEVVVAQRAAQRAGTASTRKRGEVSGGGAKPWRQKGTGRARVGSIRSPIWRGGGVVFGPKPRDYAVKISAKKRLLALRRVLGDKAESGRFFMIEKFDLAEPRTRQIVSVLRTMGVRGSCLLVDERVSRPLMLAVRNLSGVDVALADSVCVYELLRYATVIFSRNGWARMEQRIESGLRRVP